MRASTECRRESRLRYRLGRGGYRLQKSRVRHPHLDDLGGYRIIDSEGNFAVAGATFNLDLDDVEDWLATD